MLKKQGFNFGQEKKDDGKEEMLEKMLAQFEREKREKARRGKKDL